MTYAVRKDTLAGIRQSALFIKKDQSGQPLQVAVSQLLAYEATGPGMVHPEEEAFKFYYSNHVFSMIAAQYGPHEPLPEAVAALARSYVKLASDISVRLAYYCLLIITRESRHMHGNAAAHTKIKNKWGLPVSAFIQSIKSLGSMAAANRLRQTPPSTTLGQYVSGITDAFNSPGCWAGGYGGEKWGRVAETLRCLVYGETTPEMFADTAFTLAHNGGPIFDKSMLYHPQDRGKLYKVLDVQHEGMVLQLWNDDIALRPGPLSSFVAEAKALFPKGTAGYVDWFKVAASSAKHARLYAKEKQEQIAKHGPSPLATAIDKAEAQKFYVSPNEFVTIVERLKEAA
jgi:hypothetical protein